MPQPPETHERGTDHEQLWSFPLFDFEDPNSPPIIVHLRYFAGALEIYADGYGVHTMQPGQGSIMFIEQIEKRLRAVAWTDIKREDQTEEIDFEGAREELREN